jgi:type II secretory ATPase GspE/PulE/Tfp pilus assembly ATPase PilB-like protein
VDCRIEKPWGDFRIQDSGIKIKKGSPPLTLWEPVGCDSCSGTGYIGRVGIFEFLQVTPEICELIVERSDASAIRNMALKQEMHLLREDGWQKVCNGVTALGEVLRVTREEG